MSEELILRDQEFDRELIDCLGRSVAVLPKVLIEMVAEFCWRRWQNYIEPNLNDLLRRRRSSFLARCGYFDGGLAEVLELLRSGAIFRFELVFDGNSQGHSYYRCFFIPSVETSVQRQGEPLGRVRPDQYYQVVPFGTTTDKWPLPFAPHLHRMPVGRTVCVYNGHAYDVFRTSEWDIQFLKRVRDDHLAPPQP